MKSLLFKTVLTVSNTLMHGKLAGQPTNCLETIAAWTNGTYMKLKSTFNKQLERGTFHS